jgi:hypothetical protein
MQGQFVMIGERIWAEFFRWSHSDSQTGTAGEEKTKMPESWEIRWRWRAMCLFQMLEMIMALHGRLTKRPDP